MKQTATEFLFEKLWETPKDKLTWNAILEQANKMFEEQIKDAWNDDAILKLGEKYYKKTYGK
jgi:hypothetical protein